MLRGAEGRLSMAKAAAAVGRRKDVASSGRVLDARSEEARMLMGVWAWGRNSRMASGG
jgi:hypothetical protein